MIVEALEGTGEKVPNGARPQKFGKELRAVNCSVVRSVSSDR